MRCSVVTICLNAEKYLAYQLDTVAGQSWPDVEHILVDGGSTDGTLAVIESAAQKNPRLRWISEPDDGISDAMNKGLALATGDIVAFLHADDYYADREVLQRVVEVFAGEPNAQWLTGGVLHVDPAGRVLKQYPVRRWSYRRLLRGNILFHPATFVRRGAIESAGAFDTRLRYAMDYDLWLRLGERSAPLSLDLPLACFRIHPDSTSVKQVDAAFREELAVRCRYLDGKPLQKALHFLYYCLKFLPNRMSVRYADVR